MYTFLAITFNYRNILMDPSLDELTLCHSTVLTNTKGDICGLYEKGEECTARPLYIITTSKRLMLDSSLHKQTLNILYFLLYVAQLVGVTH